MELELEKVEQLQVILSNILTVSYARAFGLDNALQIFFKKLHTHTHFTTKVFCPQLYSYCR